MAGEGLAPAEMAEQRRAEHQPGNDLADHAGLAKAVEDDVHHPRGADHDDQLDEYGDEQQFRAPGRGDERCGDGMHCGYKGFRAEKKRKKSNSLAQVSDSKPQCRIIWSTASTGA
jgi:hypothetical protein